MKESAKMPELSMWTVYDHPKDLDAPYAARRFSIIDGKCSPTTDLITSHSLEAVRHGMIARGLTCLNRFPDDDPVIVEVWI